MNPNASIRLLMLSLLFLAWRADICAQSVDNVLLVVNDKSEDSKAIGRYYTQKRKLPAANACHVNAPDSETVSRIGFERDILRPVADCLRARGLQDQILYIVTTRGLPLIVAGDAGSTGDLASVDSELALTYRYLLTGGFPYQGRIENPYFMIEFNRGSFRPFTRRDYDIYLVTRLTGASSVDAILLVDRALAPEAGGDFYFDLASAQQSAAAEWTRQAAAALEDAGFKPTIDMTGKTLDNLTSVQGYFSQASSVEIPRIQWSPGAIATVMASSGITLGQPQTKTNAAAYIESGATGFGDYVGDPSPDGYLRPQILFPAYAAGYNLAEAYYAATRYLSWRTITIGDPLASPYAKNSAKQRSAMTASAPAAADQATGLPEAFAKRRQLYLTQKYATGTEAVTTLLKAEAAATRGDDAAAQPLVDRSLEQDPFIAESHFLKAQILERAGDFPRSFERYQKALELGISGRDIYLKLARLALDQLKDPKKAAPYAQWLSRRYSQADPEVAALQAVMEPPPNGHTKEAPAELTPLGSGGSVSVKLPESAPTDNIYPARIVSRAPIEYPYDAQAAGIQGLVTVSLLLDEMGQVMKTRVISGNAKLAKAVLASLRRWRFEPRLENGRAVVSYFTLPIVFELTKKSP
jgi:uncharacterized protein (TIGR03790 family)